jgi:hypothetical protein
MEYTIGSYLAKHLEEMGIEHYFAVPGDFNLMLLDELLKNDNLKQIGSSNELNAAYAAEGYARVKGAGAIVLHLMLAHFLLLMGLPVLTLKDCQLFSFLEDSTLTIQFKVIFLTIL